MTTRATLFQTMATTDTTGTTAPTTTTTAILSVMGPTLPRHLPHTTPGNLKTNQLASYRC